VVVAVRRPDGTLVPQPAPSSVIEAGDMLVAIGTPGALEQLESVTQPLAVSNR
jgi:K+/H+ antiporter YhaU regulatory subunit KhtT